MATNYTNLLGFALPTTGELAGTWGQVVNDSITELVEDSIAGAATASVTSGDWTLSTTGSGASNEARCAILIPTGTPGVSRNIIAPSSSKSYVVINASDAEVVVKGAATTGATIAAGARAVVAWNGSDFVIVAIQGGAITATTVTASQVDITATGDLRLQDTSGVQYVALQAPNTIASSYTLTMPTADGTNGQAILTDGSGNLSFGTRAALNALQTFTASQRGTVTTDNEGSFDMNATNNFSCTPTGNFTLTFTNITAGQSGFILLVNTGGYTISAAASTKVQTGALTTISAAGTYILSYFADTSTVYVTHSGAMA
jgi:hypothetical protein